MKEMSILHSGESSEDDEANSLEYRMTNEAIVASSAGGLSKSGMGRAAALGMDVGSIEANNADEQQSKSGNARFRLSFVLKKKMKKKMTSLMNKTKDVRELWPSRQLIGRQSPVTRNHENSSSDELESNASDHSHRPQVGDLFSVNAVASQRSRGVSLVNKLGMAPEVSPYLIDHGDGSSQDHWENDHNQRCRRKNEKTAEHQERQLTHTDKKAFKRLHYQARHEATPSHTGNKSLDYNFPLQESLEKLSLQFTQEDARNTESASIDRSNETAC